MNVEAIIIAATALVAALGAAIKNMVDIREIKRIACYRQPCDDRLSADALQSKSRGNTP